MSDTNSQAATNTQASGSAQSVADAATTGAGDSTTASAAAAASAPASSADATTSQQAPEGQPAADPKADGAASTEGDNNGKAGDSIVGAPETYEFKAPEGSKFDDQVIGTFSEVAKELDLSQGAAQKILDAIAPKVSERFAAKQAEAIESWKAGLADETRADKELGGEKLNENLAVAEKAIAAFGTPKLRELLVESGLGNHPEIIRAFYKAGKAISEDKFVPGGKAPTKGETNAAKALYPNQPA